MTARSDLPYQEGDGFAVPLVGGGFARGVVARMNGRGMVLAFFFGPSLPSVPDSWEIPKPEGACLVLFASDLGLLDGKWQRIGSTKGFVKAAWPIPAFGRIVRRPEGNPEIAWRVEYDESLSISSARQTRITPQEARLLPESGAAGSEYVESKLSKVLSSADGRAGPQGGGRGKTGALPPNGDCVAVQGTVGQEVIEERDRALSVRGEGEPEQAVIVHLPPTTLPRTRFDLAELEALEDRLTEAIANDLAGEFDGNEISQHDGSAVLYMYGPSAERLFVSVETVLRDHPFCRGARIEIRPGGPGVAAREVFFEAQ